MEELRLNSTRWQYMNIINELIFHCDGYLCWLSTPCHATVRCRFIALFLTKSGKYSPPPDLCNTRLSTLINMNQ